MTLLAGLDINAGRARAVVGPGGSAAPTVASHAARVCSSSVNVTLNIISRFYRVDRWDGPCL